MPKSIQSLLTDYLIEIQKIYGAHLKSVILYGSYARGDYTSDSDVDIMILVDLKDEELEQYSDALSELDFEYNVDYDIWMMPVVKNVEHFRHWVSAYPFYKNVQREGVIMYEAADSLDIGTQMDVAKHRLQVAREDLETANLTFEAGRYRGANNRAYYSIFHTISAVLAIEGVAFKKHKDTLSYFNKNYVRTEIFPRELGRKIVKAEEIRHASDYDTFYIASKEVTQQQIETAEQILTLAEKYVQDIDDV